MYFILKALTESFLDQCVRITSVRRKLQETVRQATQSAAPMTTTTLVRVKDKKDFILKLTSWDVESKDALVKAVVYGLGLHFSYQGRVRSQLASVQEPGDVWQRIGCADRLQGNWLALHHALRFERAGEDRLAVVAGSCEKQVTFYI